MKRTAMLLVLGCLLPSGLWAHCDRVDGPVAAAAREALRTGQPVHVLAWVGTAQDRELQAAYELAVKAREQGGPAADVAERYLVETAIRLHREAEGLSFAGVQPATTPLPRVVVIAEQALEKGQVEDVLALLDAELEGQVRRLFAAASSKPVDRGANLEAARHWVDAYVRYMGFVDGLYEAIEAGPEHGVGHRD